MRIRRINMDSSWQLVWGNTNIVIDPWLIGSEIDGFSWFNEQWHKTDPVAIDSFQTIDGIVISQSYSDHCHIPTIEQLNPEIPIYGTPKAFNRLKKNFKKRKLVTIPHHIPLEWIKIQNLEIAGLHPGNWMDPVYYGVLIKKDEDLLVYMAHGFQLSTKQLEEIRSYRVKLLITSFSTVALPAFLGGKVNPGLKNARLLIEQLNPEVVLNTHDEQKDHKGIVMKLAKTDYPKLDELELYQDGNLEILDDYSWREYL